MDTTNILYIDYEEVYDFFLQYFTRIYLDCPFEIPEGYTVETYIEYLATFYADAIFALIGPNVMNLLNEEGKIWVFDSSNTSKNHGHNGLRVLLVDKKKQRTPHTGNILQVKD